MFLLVNRIISVTTIATESQLSTSIKVIPGVILGVSKFWKSRNTVVTGYVSTGMADPQMQLTHVSG